MKVVGDLCATRVSDDSDVDIFDVEVREADRSEGEGSWPCFLKGTKILLVVVKVGWAFIVLGLDFDGDLGHLFFFLFLLLALLGILLFSLLG